MSKIARYEPKDGDTIDDLLAHQELLIMWCKMLLNIVKRTAKSSCCLCRDSCLSCDATQLLNELGENIEIRAGAKNGNNENDISSTDTFASFNPLDCGDL